MNGRLRAAVSALSYTAAAWQAGSDAALLGPPYNDVARFVAASLADMPRPLRWGALLGTLVFSLGGLAPARRRARAESWLRSPLAPQRNLLRLYLSLAGFALLSRRERPVAGGRLA
jgi:hypothetical protein